MKDGTDMIKRTRRKRRVSRRRLSHSELQDKRIEREWEISKKAIPDWLNDDGEIFTCKFCRRALPVDLKSKTKIGKCRLCTGGD